jgi:hypothetical protein
MKTITLANFPDRLHAREQAELRRIRRGGAPSILSPRVRFQWERWALDEAKALECHRQRRPRH